MDYLISGLQHDTSAIVPACFVCGCFALVVVMPPTPDPSPGCPTHRGYGGGCLDAFILPTSL